MIKIVAGILIFLSFSFVMLLTITTGRYKDWEAEDLAQTEFLIEYNKKKKEKEQMKQQKKMKKTV